MEINTEGLSQASVGTGNNQEKATNRAFSFKRKGLFGAPMANNIKTEEFKKMMEKLTKLYTAEVDKSSFSIKLVGIDKNDVTNLHYSVIAVLGCLPHLQSSYAYHLLLLEKTGVNPDPLMINMGNGRTVEVVRVASDAVDKILTNEVEKAMKAAYPGAKFIPTDVTIIGRRFDVENEAHVFRVARNAALAVGTALEMGLPGWTDLNLKEAEIDPLLNINLQFQNTINEDDVGNPLRSDVMISFTATDDSRKNNSLNSGNQTEVIHEVDGFLDLLWNPVAGPNVFLNPYQPMQQMATQRYSLRFVITNLISNLSYTPGGIIAALYTSLVMSESNNWVQFFRPIQTHNAVDMKDIGALAIEANFDNNPTGYGTRIDTKAESFTLADLGQLAGALIRPEILYSIDVPESGPQTWFESIFLAGYNGNENAIEEIRSSIISFLNLEAKDITNFRNIPLFSNVPDGRIHLGYYYDQEGNIRDLRDIDYLAVANLIGDSAPELIRKWSDTFTSPAYKEEERVADRNKIIRAVTRETAVVTGYARRVNFNGEVLSFIASYMAGKGYQFRINTPLTGDLFNNGRASADFLSGAFLKGGNNYFHQRPMMGSGYSPWGMPYTRW